MVGAQEVEGGTVTVTVSDANVLTADVVGTATVQGDGSWSVAGLDLSALDDGTLSIEASVNTATDTAAVVHDTVLSSVFLTRVLATASETAYIFLFARFLDSCGGPALASLVVIVSGSSTPPRSSYRPVPDAAPM